MINRHELRACSKVPGCSLGKLVIVEMGGQEARANIVTWNHVFLFVRLVGDGITHPIRFENARFPTKSELRRNAYFAKAAGQVAVR